MRSALGSGDYHRVRVGIGRPQGTKATSDYVLGPFTQDEKSDIPLLAGRSADAVASLIKVGLEATQQAFNSVRTEQ